MDNIQDQIGEFTMSDVLDSIVDSCWDSGYPCNPADDRFGIKIGRETSSREVRFDGGEDFSKKGVETAIARGMKSSGLRPRFVDSLSKYGKRRIVAEVDRDTIVVVTDELDDRDSPYVAIYYVPKKSSKLVGEGLDESSSMFIKFDEDSSRDLSRVFSTRFPDLSGWKIVCDGVDVEKGDLGSRVSLLVTSVGMTDSVVGVKATFVESEDDQESSEDRSGDNVELKIVLALNDSGERSDVDDIVDWEDLDEPKKVRGTIEKK